jgi:fucose 4-O-acetylase-like acetyltransferase
MRDKSIDAVGGIMVLHMILRHCLVGPLKETFWGGVVFYYPLLFFMAWFFYKSGMFYREEALHETIEKGVKRLIIPYVVFSVVAAIFAVVVYVILYGRLAIPGLFSDFCIHMKREGAIEFNAPLWFLLSLFCVRSFFSLSRKLHIPAACVAVCSLGCAYGLYLAGLPIGLYFENIALGLFFFSLGYILKRFQYHDSSFIGASLYYVSYLFYCFVSQSVVGEFIINTHTPYLPTIGFYIAGCILINNLFHRLRVLQIGLFLKAGEHSMTLYVTHFIILSVVLTINNKIGLLSPLVLFFVLIVSLSLLLPLFVPLFSKPGLRWMVGEGSVRLFSINETVAIVSTTLFALAMMSYVILHIVYPSV